MKNKVQVEKSVLLHRVKRIFKWVPSLIIIFLLVSFALFQIPKIQTRLLNEISSFIAKNTSFRLTIGHANLTWYDEFILEEVRLYQAANDSTMIMVNAMSIDFGLIHYLFNQEIVGDELTLISPKLHIIKPNDSTEMNINQFIGELKAVFKKEKANKKTSIYIEEVSIENGLFSFNQIDTPPPPSGKDYFHFRYDSLNSHIINLSYENDSIGMNIDSLASVDPNTDLDIKHLSGAFHFTKKSLGFTDMKLKTNRSTISDSIILHYDSPDHLKYFLDSVEFDISLKESIIDHRDIAIFNQAALKIGSPITLSGSLLGTVSKLSTQNLQLDYGHSHIQGDGYFGGLPDIKETFIDFHFDQSFIQAADFKSLLTDNIYDKLDKLKTIQLEGNFAGFVSNFVANGTALSEMGFIKSDLNMRIDNKSVAHYSGKIDLQNFRINEVFQELGGIRNITMNGEIKGKGLEVNNANFDLNANIDSIQLNNISLNNISTVGHFEKQFLNADFEIYDPKLIFSGIVEVDIREDHNKFRIDANMDTLDLYAMGVTKEPLVISSVLDINMKGLKLDDMRGYVMLSDNFINFKSKRLKIDSINLISSLISDFREISLYTDNISAELKGSFSNQQLVKSFTELYQEIYLNLQNDSASLNQYYLEKQHAVIQKLSADLELRMRDINEYIEPFYPDFHISKNIKIDSRIVQDSISTLTFHSSIDTLKYKSHSLHSTLVDLSLSKNYFSKDVLASLTSQSESQVWQKGIQSENFNAEIIWDKSLMTVWASIKQPEFNNNINLSSEINFLNDQTTIHMVPARLRLLDQRWVWNQTNQINIKKEGVEFIEFGLTNQNQKLEANGRYGDNNAESVKIDLSEISLSSIQSLIPFSLEGTLDGGIRVQKGEKYSIIDGEIVADSIKIQDFLLGNLFINSLWDHETQGLMVKMDLARNGEKKIELAGEFFPNRSENQLDISASFVESDLEAIDPFVQKNFSHLKGKITGEIKIGGNLSSPSFIGQTKITEGHALVKYLNARYDFNGDISLNGKKLTTQNLKLVDRNGNNATITGDIEFLDAKNLALNLDGRFQNFQILNTSIKNNSLYYGSAVTTGNVQFRGTTADLIISASAKSERGTKLFLPIGQKNKVKTDQKEYIQFVNLSEQDDKQEEQKELSIEPEPNKIKGIRLDLDLEFTPEAYIELIFDIKSGDIIRGRGDGSINLAINRDGDFTMFGDYSIQQGGYNFTLYNIINKEFEIQKGSNIAWYGNPYGAILNIDASYIQQASLFPILNNLTEDEQNANELRKKYPTKVDLKLTQNLLAPDIKFGISIEDYPRRLTLNSTGRTYDLESQVNAFKNKIRNNEQEMNRQVFSLLVLRKFSPEDNIEFNTATLGTSLSEFVSNQLSYWATQVDENLEIDVDLASLDEDAFNTFQLRMSYTFMDGRLKVTRGGGIPNEQNNNNVYSYIGDWSVEYLITEDGRFRAKVYSRADLNTIQSNENLNNNSVETGFSLQFIRSFDELKEILRDSREKNLEKDSPEVVE